MSIISHVVTVHICEYVRPWPTPLAPAPTERITKNKIQLFIYIKILLMLTHKLVLDKNVLAFQCCVTQVLAINVQINQMISIFSLSVEKFQSLVQSTDRELIVLVKCNNRIAIIAITPDSEWKCALPEPKSGPVNREKVEKRCSTQLILHCVCFVHICLAYVGMPLKTCVHWTLGLNAWVDCVV